MSAKSKVRIPVALAVGAVAVFGAFLIVRPWILRPEQSDASGEVCDLTVGWLKDHVRVTDEARGWSGSNLYYRAKIDGMGEFKGGFGLLLKISPSNETVCVQGISLRPVDKKHIAALRELVVRSDCAAGDSMAILYLDGGGSLRCRSYAPFESIRADVDATLSLVVGAITEKLGRGERGLELVCKEGVSPSNATERVMTGFDDRFDRSPNGFDDVLMIVKKWFDGGYFEMSMTPSQARFSAFSRYDESGNYAVINYSVRIGSWVLAECQHYIDFSYECWRPDEWFAFINDYNSRQDKVALQMDVNTRRAHFQCALPISALRLSRTKERLEAMASDMMTLPERQVWATIKDINRIISVR